MAVFIGNALANIANSTGAGTLIGFAGGSIALLQDAIGDTFVALAGNDTIVAGNSNDVIIGGDGNDFIDGRFGLDLMDGGNGIDTMDVSFFGGAYVWNMDTGITNFSAQGEFAFNFENARTGAGADSITGNSANNNISLGAGNDFANGASGNDNLFGDVGNDTLLGDRGNDTLNGGTGNDSVNGGVGNDRLTGGAGFDSFVFNTSPNTITNIDFITDFSSAFDTIRLENAIFTALPAGPLAAAAFRAGFVALDATDRIVYNSATGNIFYDPDGFGGAAQVSFARVLPGTAVNFTDFFVI
jgi:Ca2+-binding RTX toxin-like protein